MRNVRSKGVKRRLAFAFFLTVWLLKSILGFIAAVIGNSPEYPDAVRGFPHPYMGDMEFYVVAPAMFALLNLLMFALASKIPKWVAIVFVVVQMFMWVVLLLLGTGGI